MNQLTDNSYLYGMKLKIKEEKWFKLEFAVAFVSIIIQALISYSVYHALFLKSSNLDANEITLYYIVINIESLMMQGAQYVAWKHMNMINDGSIILRIMRPDSYILSEYLNCLSGFLKGLVINMLFIIAGKIILLKEVCVTDIICGVISLVLGFTILYLIQAIIGCLAIWFHDIIRLRDVIMTLLMVLGGQLLPSDLLFGELKKIVYYTPIPYIYDVPVKQIIGNGNSLQILAQLIWTIFFAGIYVWLYKRFVSHNVEFGG